MMQFTTLELGILIVAGSLALLLNVLASVRCLRGWGRFGIPYLLLVWLVPVVGALYVLAKVRPARPTPFIPISTPTQGLDPKTIQGDPWPTLSQPVPPPRKRRH